MGRGEGCLADVDAKNIDTVPIDRESDTDVG